MSAEPTQTTDKQPASHPTNPLAPQLSDQIDVMQSDVDARDDDESALDAAGDGHESAAAATARKILIGSQRDPANRKLSPQKPKPVREAAKTFEAAALSVDHHEPMTEPAAAVESTTVAAAVAAVETASPSIDAATTQPVTAVADEFDVSEYDFPRVEIKPPSGDDLEREINEALGGMSMDQMIAQQEALHGGMELEEGSRHKGTVVKIHRDDVFFSLGGSNEGVVSLRQFKKPPKDGAMMDVVVRGFNAEDGLYELGIPGASVSVADWTDIAEGAVIEVRISGSNTGGLECMVHNIRGFIPASQIATHRVENLSEYINQKLLCVVQEVNPRRRKLVLSHRAVMERQQEEQRKDVLGKIEVGQTLEGTVTSIRDFGAFVDLGGIDGLIHISKLSWDRVEHPKEVLTEGQKIKVKVEKINTETGKIALTYRDLLEHPWDKVEEKYPVTSIVTGTISRVANFGAFVRLEAGIEGLIHISELAHHRVMAVSNIVKEGEVVECKILSVDRDAQRMALSLKATIQAPEPKGSKPQDETPDDEPPRDPLVPRRKKPLKGGRDKPSGGEKFGLNW